MNINYPPYRKYASTPLNSPSGGGDFIVFLDDNILKSLGLDRLSYKNAKSMFMLGGSFIENDEIVSFDEFKYFGIKSISGPNEFKGSSNLESIVIPKTCTYISATAFNDCSNLKTVVILNPNTEIDPNAFKGCNPEIHIVTPNMGIGFWAIGSTFVIW